jgi:transposase
MEVVYPRCSGLDVHKRFVVACLSMVEKGQRYKELRHFTTMMHEILLPRCCPCRFLGWHLSRQS